MLKFDLYKKIYKYWANKLRKLNITIKHIFNSRNKIANNLSKIIFNKLYNNSNFIINYELKVLREQDLT